MNCGRENLGIKQNRHIGCKTCISFVFIQIFCHPHYHVAEGMLLGSQFQQIEMNAFVLEYWKTTSESNQSTYSIH
jgi:hypothetical protein